MKFKDRKDAGRKLAEHAATYRDTPDLLVLALPRGGVPVAYEVAKGLNAPMDVFLVRKLGTPGHEELAMGAIASGGVRVLNRQLINYLNIPESQVEAVAEKEEQELQRREREYRGDRSRPDLENRTVFVVDDGLATGASMKAAVQGLREMNPRKIIVAVPTAAQETCEDLGNEADEIICLSTPAQFSAVGAWYEDFSQTTDEEVKELLRKAEEELRAA